MILPSVTKNKLYVFKNFTYLISLIAISLDLLNIIKKDIVANLVQNVQSYPSFGRV